MHEADVVVVGGGPAGAAAAITCACAGLQVVMLERCATPRARPGETLHPGVEPLFDRLGVSQAVNGAGFLRHEGIRVRWDGPARFQAYGGDAGGPWRGFQAWRSSFDEILQAAAGRRGVDVRPGATAASLLMSRGRVTGVRTPHGDIEASWVIDAAGGSHWGARHAGIRIHRLSPALFARYGYVRQRGGDPPSLDADAAGWTWSAEVQPGLVQWTRLDFETTPARRVPIAGEPCSRTRAADVTWRWVPRSAGPGYFLVGDAAAVLDPASSHGVLRALMTGMQAGHLIAHVRHRRASERRALGHYRAWLRSWFEHDVRVLKRLYASLPSPPAWLGRVGVDTR